MPKPGTPPPPSIYDHALTVGFSRAFLVAAGIGLLGLIIALATIRVRRQDLSGVKAAPPAPEPQPEAARPQPVTAQPAAVQQSEELIARAAAARPCRFC